jgi:hypothetical protein
MKANSYTIRMGDQIAGWVHEVTTDMPFVGGRFEEGPDFHKIGEFFEEEWRLLKARSDQKWMALMRELDLRGLRIVRPDQTEMRFCEPTASREGGFALLHVRNGKAWWRPT